MNRRKIFLATTATAVLFAVLAYVATRPVHLEIEVPTVSAKAPPLLGETQSHVTMELAVSLDELRRGLNQHFPRRFAGSVGDPTDALTQDSVNWSVERGDIEFFPQGDAIGFRMPLPQASASLEGVFGVKRKNKGPLGWLEQLASVKFSETAHFGGRVTGSIKPVVNSDWTVNPNLKLEVHLDKAEAYFFGKAVKVSFRGEIRKELDKAARKFVDETNAKLKSDPRLHEELEIVWAKLHHAERLVETPSTWLSSRPNAIAIAEPVVEDGMLVLKAGASVSTAVLIQSGAPAVERSPLPPPTGSAVSTEGFALSVAVGVKLDEFERRRAKELGLARKITHDGSTLEIADIRLYGDDGELFLGVDVIASKGFFERVEGTLYLKGAPVLDPRSGRLLVNDLAYDLHTSDALLQAANWLLADDFLAELQKRAVFNHVGAEGELLARANEEIAKAKTRLPDGVEAELHLRDISLSRLVVDDGWLVAVIDASGPARLEITSLDDLLRSGI
jgi:hypothetical protein